MAGANTDGPIRTLFVTGLPPDVRDREIYLLCRLCPGYEGNAIKFNPGKTPVAFCLFDSAENAAAAVANLEGAKLDPDGQHQVHAEFAKSNIHTFGSDRQGGQDGGKRARSGAGSDPYAAYAAAAYAAPPPHAAAYGAPPSVAPGADPYAAYGGYGGYPAAPPMHGAPQPVSHMPGIPAPALGTTCTLFVTGLGPTATEPELQQLFQAQYGYKRLRMMHQGQPKAVCFVEFTDNGAAAASLNAMQGAMVGSSGRPLRLEFAKSDMRT